MPFFELSTGLLISAFLFEDGNSSMVKQAILVTGGVRSGKSQYAEQRALELGERRLYFATAEASDVEMARRIAEHQKRRGGEWTTIEEPMELSSALLAQRGRTDCALVDCLTIWLSNLLLHRDADFVQDRVEQFLGTLAQLDFHVVLVTNEVGWGIVPDNPLARQFRDLTGWANQQIATVATEVILMVAGVPMVVKKSTICS
jgi:adenosylcobinamide kinase / adenosylcobinamide-phosphate guanylyltransferase